MPDHNTSFLSSLRVAIVHDWLVTPGGAEKVLADLLELLPQADLFSSVDFFEPTARGLIGGRQARTSFIQRLPLARRRYRDYLPLMPLAIEQFDLSAYHLVLSSSHAIAKGVITGPDQLHVCYCHSPMRYAWDMQAQYLAEAGLQTGLKSMLARWILSRMRLWDYRTANGVDHFIANSDYIARRIWKIYRRDATTIHPGVDTDRFEVCTEKSDFYLTASRMVPYKKMDMIVRAFARMPEKKLIVIGDGPQMAKVRSAAAPNITLMGYQDNDVLRDHMQRARAFVFAAEEDFGIIPVEAQACGTPVIAYAKGGALETIRDGQTGLLFREQTEAAIIDAVNRFEHAFLFDPLAIRQHAECFSRPRFKDRMRSHLETQVRTHPVLSNYI